MYYSVLITDFNIGYRIPALCRSQFFSGASPICTVDINQAFIFRFEYVDSVTFFCAQECYAYPPGPDAGSFRIVMNVLGEVGTHVCIGTIFDVGSNICSVFFNEGNKFVICRIACIRIIFEDNRLAVAAAFDFPIGCKQEPRRFTGY